MPTEPLKEVRRILFIRTDRIGDVLMNLPAVRLLRQNYPKAWIAWMVDRSVAPLLRGHPDVDEIFEIDAEALCRSARERRALIRQVRRIGFDLAVASNADKFLHWMMFRAGIRHRAGWRRKWGFLLNHSLPDDKAAASRHEIDSNLRLVGLVAAKAWDGTWVLPVEESAKRAVEKRLAAELGVSDVIAVHAGTSDPAKRWGAEKFAEVCRRLALRGTRVLLIGGSEEEAQSRELSRRIGAGVVDWTGALDLAELSATLRSPRIKTLFSVDSGPVHVAWLHGKPVVALYAKNKPGSDPVRWGPKSPGSVAIHKDIAEISAEEVLRAIEAVLAR